MWNVNIADERVSQVKDGVWIQILHSCKHVGICWDLLIVIELLMHVFNASTKMASDLEAARCRDDEGGSEVGEKTMDRCMRCTRVVQYGLQASMTSRNNFVAKA